MPDRSWLKTEQCGRCPSRPRPLRCDAIAPTGFVLAVGRKHALIGRTMTCPPLEASKVATPTKRDSKVQKNLFSFFQSRSDRIVSAEPDPAVAAVAPGTPAKSDLAGDRPRFSDSPCKLSEDAFASSPLATGAAMPAEEDKRKSISDLPNAADADEFVGKRLVRIFLRF